MQWLAKELNIVNDSEAAAIGLRILHKGPRPPPKIWESQHLKCSLQEQVRTQRSR